MFPNLFLSNDALPQDSQLFFGSLDDNDKVHTFNKSAFTMADMAVNAGFFPSRSQARKNGWPTDPVPLGFGSKKCGKRFVFWFNSMDNICE